MSHKTIWIKSTNSFAKKIGIYAADEQYGASEADVVYGLIISKLADEITINDVQLNKHG